MINIHILTHSKMKTALGCSKPNTKAALCYRQSAISHIIYPTVIRFNSIQIQFKFILLILNFSFYIHTGNKNTNETSLARWSP